jgi:hypothetical protein
MDAPPPFPPSDKSHESVVPSNYGWAIFSLFLSFLFLAALNFSKVMFEKEHVHMVEALGDPKRFVWISRIQNWFYLETPAWWLLYLLPAVLLISAWTPFFKRWMAPAFATLTMLVMTFFLALVPYTFLAMNKGVLHVMHEAMKEKNQTMESEEYRQFIRQKREKDKLEQDKKE